MPTQVESKFKIGDHVMWTGTPAIIEGRNGQRWLVWTGTYLCEVWESELTKIES